MGSGAYGLVFEGTLALPGKEEEKVILKKGKQSVNGTRVRAPNRRSSPQLLRRLSQPRTKSTAPQRASLSRASPPTLPPQFLRTEVAIARRLKGVKGVAPFLGVAGADSFLVWKHLGLETLEDFMARRATAQNNKSSDSPPPACARFRRICVSSHRRPCPHRPGNGTHFPPALPSLPPAGSARGGPGGHLRLLVRAGRGRAGLGRAG